MTANPLLPQVVAGDASAFGACIDRHGGLIHSLARRFVPGPEVEDAVQEIFIELWKSAERFDPSLASETTFIAMIARRRLIDRQRRARSRPTTEGLPEGVPSQDDWQARLEISQEAALAFQELGNLDPARRQVLELAVNGGLTHKEIAGKTGLPLGTVKTHVRRGLMQIRQRLNDREPAAAVGGAQ